MIFLQIFFDYIFFSWHGTRIISLPISSLRHRHFLKVAPMDYLQYLTRYSLAKQLAISFPMKYARSTVNPKTRAFSFFLRVIARVNR